MQITVLVDNESCRPDVKAEWGMSVHIQWEQHAILVDMGSTGLFADNARTLGLRLDAVKLAVLSHAHIDHGGGLGRFFAENSNAPVWARTGIPAELYLGLGIARKRVGLDPDIVAKHIDRFRLVDADTQILPGVHVLTSMASTFPAPRGNQILLRREGGNFVPDDFRHELTLVVDDGDGMVVFTGCSHHGVLNMLAGVRQVFPARPVKAIVGGFHFVGIPLVGLFGDKAEAISEVAEKLADSAIPRILTMHCTGRPGFESLRKVIGPGVQYLAAGATINL